MTTCWGMWWKSPQKRWAKLWHKHPSSVLNDNTMDGRIERVANALKYMNGQEGFPGAKLARGNFRRGARYWDHDCHRDQEIHAKMKRKQEEMESAWKNFEIGVGPLYRSLWAQDERGKDQQPLKNESAIKRNEAKTAYTIDPITMRKTRKDAEVVIDDNLGRIGDVEKNIREGMRAGYEKTKSMSGEKSRIKARFTKESERIPFDEKAPLEERSFFKPEPSLEEPLHNAEFEDKAPLENRISFDKPEKEIESSTTGKTQTAQTVFPEESSEKKSSQKNSDSFHLPPVDPFPYQPAASDIGEITLNETKDGKSVDKDNTVREPSPLDPLNLSRGLKSSTKSDMASKKYVNYEDLLASISDTRADVGPIVHDSRMNAQPAVAKPSSPVPKRPKVLKQDLDVEDLLPNDVRKTYDPLRQTDLNELNSALRETQKEHALHKEDVFRMKNAYEYSKEASSKHPHTLDRNNFFTPVVRPTRHNHEENNLAREYIIVMPSRKLIQTRNRPFKESTGPKDLFSALSEMPNPEKYVKVITKLEKAGWSCIGGGGPGQLLVFERVYDAGKRRNRFFWRVTGSVVGVLAVIMGLAVIESSGVV